jgi:hypothetical protein
MAAPPVSDAAALTSLAERAEAAASAAADASTSLADVEPGLSALVALRDADVTLAVLSATGLGRRMRKLAKAADGAGEAGAQLADAARAVVDAWKAKMTAGSAASPAAGDAEAPAAAPAAAAPAAKRPKVEAGGAGKEEAGAAGKKEEKEAPPAKGMKREGSSLALTTDDPARNKLRELLTAALQIAGAPQHRPCSMSRTKP